MEDRKDIFERIARIDERTSSMEKQIMEIKQGLQGEYVRAVEFAPVKDVVYGLVGLILTVVIGALIALVIRR